MRVGRVQRPLHSLSRRRMGRAGPRRPGLVRNAEPRRRASGVELAHHPQEARELSTRVPQFRRRESRALRAAREGRAPRRRGYRPQPAEDRRRDRQRQGLSRSPQGIRIVRSLHRASRCPYSRRAIHRLRKRLFRSGLQGGSVARCVTRRRCEDEREAGGYRPGSSPLRVASNRNQWRRSASSIQTSSRLAVATSPCSSQSS